MCSHWHCRRVVFRESVHSTSTFLPPFAPLVLPGFNAHMRALTSAALASPTHALTGLRISMLWLSGLLTIPSPTTVLPCSCRQLHTTPIATGVRKAIPGGSYESARVIRLRFGFHHQLAGSPVGLAETGSLYYGLVVLLQLLPTSDGTAIPAAPPTQLLSNTGRRVTT